MAVYIAESLNTTRIKEGIEKLKSGDALQIFDFESEDLLMMYLHAIPRMFKGYERRNLKFERNSRINPYSDRYILIRKK